MKEYDAGVMSCGKPDFPSKQCVERWRLLVMPVDCLKWPAILRRMADMIEGDAGLHIKSFRSTPDAIELVVFRDHVESVHDAIAEVMALPAPTPESHLKSVP